MRKGFAACFAALCHTRVNILNHVPILIPPCLPLPNRPPRTAFELPRAPCPLWPPLFLFLYYIFFVFFQSISLSLSLPHGNWQAMTTPLGWPPNPPCSFSPLAPYRTLQSYYFISFPVQILFIFAVFFLPRAKSYVSLTLKVLGLKSLHDFLYRPNISPHITQSNTNGSSSRVLTLQHCKAAKTNINNNNKLKLFKTHPNYIL